MYDCYKSGELPLWCDILKDDDVEPPQKGKLAMSQGDKIRKIQVESVFNDL